MKPSTRQDARNESLGRLRAGVSRCNFALCAAALAACNATAAPAPEGPAPTARCDDNRIAIQEPLRPRDLYIDWIYLDLLTNPPTGPNSPRGGRSSGDATPAFIKYFLKKDLIALETNLPKQFTWERAQGSVARVSLWPAGSPACLPRSWTWPSRQELRRHGVPPGQCVGVEWLPAPSASTRVTVSPSTAYISERFKLLRLDILAGPVDAQGRIKPRLEIVDHIGQTDFGNGQSFGGAISICPDRNAALEALDTAIVGPGHPLVHKPAAVSVALPSSAMSELARGLPPMPDDRFARLQWLETARERKGISGFFLVDERGEVWTDGHGHDDSWRIYAVQSDRILESLLPKEGRPTTYSTLALAKTPSGGYAVALEILGKAPVWRLFEFDHDLVLRGAFTLNAEQAREASTQATSGPR